MNEITTFVNPNFGEVRTLEINGEIWFVGKDIAEILGYSNTRDALAKHVDTEDKDTVVIHDGSQSRNVIAINESGLYSLILSNKLPSAKEFKHWVTSEILPSVRRHGAFMTTETLEQVLTSPDFLIRLVTELKNEKEKNDILARKIYEDKPKVIFANAVNASSTAILIGELAKILKQNGVLNMGQNRLFTYLRNHGYLIKINRTDFNMPTQKSMEMGLFEIREHVVKRSDGSIISSKTVRVTGKGQIYFVNLFLGNGGEE